MSDTVFVNGVTLSDADWFNDVDRLHYTIFGDPTDIAAVRTALLMTGTWTTPAYNAGDFTGNVAMTWTVGAGNVQTFEYTIINKMMTVLFLIGGTAVGGTPNNTLSILIPASKTATKGVWNGCFDADASNVGGEAGFCRVSASGTTIDIIRPSSAIWTAGSNVTVAGQITFEIN